MLTYLFGYSNMGCKMCQVVSTYCDLLRFSQFGGVGVNNAEDGSMIINAGLSILTVKDVASSLHLHCNTVRRKAATGAIPGRKIGGQWRFRAEAIKNLLPEL